VPTADEFNQLAAGTIHPGKMQAADLTCRPAKGHNYLWIVLGFMLRVRVRVRVSIRVKIKVRVSSSILSYCQSAGLVHRSAVHI